MTTAAITGSVVGISGGVSGPRPVTDHARTPTAATPSAAATGQAIVVVPNPEGDNGAGGVFRVERSSAAQALRFPYFAVELLPQELAPAGQARLDGRERDVELARDRAGTQVAPVAQEDRRALRFRQRAGRGQDLAAELELLLDAGEVGGAFGARHALFADRPAALAASPVDRQVPQHALRTSPGFVGAVVTQGQDPGVLHQVLGLVGVSDQFAREAGQETMGAGEFQIDGFIHGSDLSQEAARAGDRRSRMRIFGRAPRFRVVRGR